MDLVWNTSPPSDLVQHVHVQELPASVPRMLDLSARPSPWFTPTSFLLPLLFYPTFFVQTKRPLVLPLALLLLFLLIRILPLLPISLSFHTFYPHDSNFGR